MKKMPEPQPGCADHEIGGGGWHLAHVQGVRIVWTAALLACFAASVLQAQQAPAPVAGASAEGAPVADAARPMPRRPLRPASVEAHLQASMMADNPAVPGAERGPSIRLGARTNQPIILPERQRVRDVMQDELDRSALQSQRARAFADIPPEMPELLDDDYIRHQRSRAAERVIGNAIEAGFASAVMGGKRHEASVSIRPMFSTRDSGMRLDASPTWSYRVIGPRSGLRFDAPLAPTSSLKLHAWKELRGTDRSPQRLGAGISVDPFDLSMRCGVTFEF